MGKKIITGIKRKGEKIKFLAFGDEPQISVANTPQITLSGNKQVQIEGCSGIIDYTETIMKISIKKGFITFIGKGFRVVSFFDNQILFTGEVASIEYSV